MTNKTFFVCSYGGSGSKMLCNALSKYGDVKHVHSRNPPDKLEYVYQNWIDGVPLPNEETKSKHLEWFSGVAVPIDEIKNYYIIYIYRNPSFSIPSRFINPDHLFNIQCNPNVKFENVLKTGNDLYKIKEFHYNYTKPNSNRNYKIYCVKYEDIFDKQDELY